MENTNSSDASNILNIITKHTTLSPIILNINNKYSIQPKLNNTQLESFITSTLKLAHIISTQHQSSIIKTSTNISKFDLLNAIQEIEFSIYLDQISSISEYNNSIFSTGLSPHYYDGPFSLQKTCKQMRFRYLCLPHIIKKNGFDKWTMLLHNDTINKTLISNNTKHILSILQHQYNFYNYNIFHQLIQRINIQNQIFIKPNINILMYGNSHLKQVVMGFFCTLMSINSNSIIKYIPTIIYCNDTWTHETYDLHNTFCLDAPFVGMKESNNRNQNGLHLNESFINEIYQTQFVKHNMCPCTTDFVQIELMNNVTIYYIFANRENPKSLYNETLKFKNKYNLNLDLTSFDLILFNVGNGHAYEIETNALNYDLAKMNHLNKPVIFHRSWYEVDYRYLIPTSPQWIVDIEKVNDLRKRFPYLIYISTYRRYAMTQQVDIQMYYNLKESNVYGHFCNPGMPEHYSMSVLHLIDVLTTVVN